MKAWYYVVLSNNKDAYVLAEDDEEAAWKAVDVDTLYNLKLIDVSKTRGLFVTSNISFKNTKPYLVKIIT